AAGSYRDVPSPRRLFNGYAERPKAEVLAALAAERVKAFEVNSTRHERKARFWRGSLARLANGVTLMGVCRLVPTGQHDTRARPGVTSPSPSASATAYP